MFRNKYGISNHQCINEYVSQCKEFNNLNNDYKHFKTFHSSKNDTIKLNQLLNEYTAIYDFLPNFNHQRIFNKSINSSISIDQINSFNTKMNHIYCKLNKLNENNDNNTITHLKIQNITPSPSYHSININKPKGKNVIFFSCLQKRVVLCIQK